jgi:hypothetical protein
MVANMCDLRIISKIRLKDRTIVDTEHLGCDPTIFYYPNGDTKNFGYIPPKDKKPGFYYSLPYSVTGYIGDVYFDGKRFLKEAVDYDVYEWKHLPCGMPGRWDSENRKFIPMPELIDKVYTLDENKDE